jgi:hypothetical protein
MAKSKLGSHKFSVLFIAMLMSVNSIFITHSASAAKFSETQKLRLNIKSCQSILNKSIGFESVRASITSTDYQKLRLIYSQQAKFIDSFYYKTFGLVAAFMGPLRDEIWQVADRSADLNRVNKTTRDPIEISDLTYALESSLEKIEFNLIEFASSCRTLKGFKFRSDLFTEASLISLNKFTESFNCTNYSKSSEFAPYVKEWGACTFDGGNIKVYSFASDKELKAFMDSIFEYGITEANLVIKNLFIAAPDDLSKLDSIRLLILK